MDFSKIVTKKEFEELGVENIAFIKQRALDIKNRRDYKVHIKTSHNSMQTSYTSNILYTQLAHDEINRIEYINESITFKNVLNSNIIFPDYIKLFNILTDNNVTFNILANISKRVTNLKLKSQINETILITLEDKYSSIEKDKKVNEMFLTLLENDIIKDIPKSKSLEPKIEILKIIICKLCETTNADKNMEIIIRKLKHYYHTIDNETIINRLIQIVAYEKDLYSDYENYKIKRLNLFDKK